MSVQTDIREVLLAARKALKPAFVPIRTLKASGEMDCIEAILTEVHQTILPRLLTFVTMTGARVVIFAAERRVYSVRSSGEGGVVRAAPSIVETLRSFAEDLPSVTVASAPPPPSVTPKGDGHLAQDLILSLKAPEPEPEPEIVEAVAEAVPESAQAEAPDVQDYEPEDDIEAVHDKICKIARGVSIRTRRGNVSNRSADDLIQLGDHIKSVAEDISDHMNFLDEVVPGEKLIVHSKMEQEAPALAFTSAEEKALLISFDKENLAPIMQAWQSIFRSDANIN